MESVVPQRVIQSKIRMSTFASTSTPTSRRSAARPILLSILLVAVILISTLVLHLAVLYPWHRALYRTISLMATAADMKVDEPEDRWFAIFASSLSAPR